MKGEQGGPGPYLHGPVGKTDGNCDKHGPLIWGGVPEKIIESWGNE